MAKVIALIPSPDRFSASHDDKFLLEITASEVQALLGLHHRDWDSERKKIVPGAGIDVLRIAEAAQKLRWKKDEFERIGRKIAELGEFLSVAAGHIDAMLTVPEAATGKE